MGPGHGIDMSGLAKVLEDAHAPPADEVREAVERCHERVAAPVLGRCSLADIRTLLRSHAAQAAKIEKLGHWFTRAETEDSKTIHAQALEISVLKQERDGLAGINEQQAQRIGELEGSIELAECMLSRAERAEAERDALKARAERAEAELCEALAAAHCHIGEFEAMAERLKGEESANAALKNRVVMLEKYAQHTPTCELVRPCNAHVAYCTCGLSALRGAAADL